MQTSSAVVLSARLQKRTDSRAWRRALNQHRFKPKLVTLREDATLEYGDDADDVKSFTVTPAGASLLSHEEEMEIHVRHAFSVRVVPRDEPGGERSLLILQAGDAAEADAWVEAANQLSLQRLGPEKKGHVLHLLQAWGDADAVDKKEAVRMARSLNVKLPAYEFDDAWERSRRENRWKMSFDEFVFFMRGLAVNDAMRDLYRVAGGADDHQLTTAQLAAVLQIAEPDATALMEAHHSRICDAATMQELLFDTANSVFDEAKLAEKHDMTLPLNNYLVTSSHNTYLRGGQLSSDSSPEMYRIVLQKGCRCVEVDAWDGEDGEPIVTHGHTMTSDILLVDVLRAISQYSFSDTMQCPVIVSIENHMCEEQQRKAAAMIESTFGDALYTAPLAFDELPSPAELYGKILIKAKTGTSVHKPGADGKSIDEDQDDDTDEGDEQQSPGVSSSSASDKSKDEKKKKKQIVVVPELAKLVTIAGGSRKALSLLWAQGKSGADMYLAASCVSVSESKLADILSESPPGVVPMYNKHGMTRVYPKGTRVDSSNYNPTLAWHLGCQIVALNWQHQDSGLAVNQARFLANGGCGYILTSQTAATMPDASGTLSVEIVSGSLLPKALTTGLRDEVVDPYCDVKIFDVSNESDEDNCSFKFETRHVKGNGYAPAWRQSFKVHIKNRNLATLYLRVFDYDKTSTDDLIGYIAVPISMMRTGLRSFPLNDPTGKPLIVPGTSRCPSVLCHVKWE